MKREWVARMASSMEMVYPDLSPDDIHRMVSKIYDQHVTDHKAQLYNNYENVVADTTLLSMVDWFDKKSPLIAESGVYFYQKSEKRNVNVEIIKECMLDARDIHKNEMYAAMDIGDVFLAAIKKIQQLNDKKAANSGYGAEGQSSSFLYNIHSAMSVTASGRGQLSTACQCFENFLADNVKFFDMDEFFTWIYNIVHEESTWKYRTRDIISHYPTREEFVARYVNKFAQEDLADVEMIEAVYDSLDKDMRARVFYKANIRGFLMNRVPSAVYAEIAATDVSFIDPNKVPKELSKYVSELVEMTLEFVNYKYSIFRYEDRTRYQKRACVVVMDTDSNFILYKPLLDFIMENVLPYKMFKKGFDYDTYKLRILNVLACFTTGAIAETLFNYLSHVNVPEVDRPRIKMKNEYYYSRVIITFAKKSYIGLQRRQEAHIFDKPNLDVKGVNFFKSTASESTSKFIYDKILMDQLLAPKDGRVSLRRTYSEIYKYQKKIAGEIAKGDMGYLKRSIKVKSPDAYAKPMSNGSYKAVYVWNMLNGEREQISLPATVTLVKVKLQSRADVAALENWPDIYEKVMHLFDTDPEIGETIDPTTGKPRRGKGIKAIALPNEMDDVPDWVLAVIDVETLVNDNFKLFTQLARPLGFSDARVTHRGASMVYYSNIVRI